ncbi:hypothetical protein VTN00DRAFT_556 [Thermoascus crustaceus]|uniref:uncharacterized protein n=1 Tax=Thermoascus crustaceus TaxID=5088 RepID=UPI0037434426
MKNTKLSHRSCRSLVQSEHTRHTSVKPDCGRSIPHRLKSLLVFLRLVYQIPNIVENELQRSYQKEELKLKAIDAISYQELALICILELTRDQPQITQNGARGASGIMSLRAPGDCLNL